MRRLRTACAVVALAVLALAACTDAPPEPIEVTVTGDAGVAPTLTYVAPLAVDKTQRETIWDGTGPVLEADQPVLIDYWLENATDATLVRESYSTNPSSQFLTPQDLGEDLYHTLVGQHVGARLLQISPPSSDESATDYPTVTVIDVLPTRASGDPVDVTRTDLPTVTRDDDGRPSLTPATGDAPTELVTQPLLRGTGRQVAAKDTITVQYTGWAWDGVEFDSTWGQRIPVSLSLLDVPTWADALVDQTTGSQVMVVVPPSYPLGVTQSEELAGQTVVFVVDILDSRAPLGSTGDG
ncbi:FKBP-type peptidyl-prolyl cis-trans isomerase [Cellulomonas composti]|uniref:Peptidyl-prolyl cis-trans isomerase n=1 Tax=Cellulomonas composti TaxID=266130 RepID=A0A511J616_9CELL|nr:FKBP-type peptidyl-prolyl cis-trans isomerase [Cellulomonas composti]GEL93452.1 peptidylprolyl isomerase [Cellulomonas composti]